MPLVGVSRPVGRQSAGLRPSYLWVSDRILGVLGLSNIVLENFVSESNHSLCCSSCYLICLGGSERRLLVIFGCLILHILNLFEEFDPWSHTDAYGSLTWVRWVPFRIKGKFELSWVIVSYVSWAIFFRTQIDRICNVVRFVLHREFRGAETLLKDDKILSSIHLFVVVKDASPRWELVRSVEAELGRTLHMVNRVDRCLPSVRHFLVSLIDLCHKAVSLFIQ